MKSSGGGRKAFSAPKSMPVKQRGAAMPSGVRFRQGERGRVKPYGVGKSGKSTGR